MSSLKSVLLWSGRVALWMMVYLLLFLGVMFLYSPLAKPFQEICSDLRLPVWVCGTGTWTWHTGVEHLRQTHYSTKVFLFLAWLLAAIWADRESRSLRCAPSVLEWRNLFVGKLAAFQGVTSRLSNFYYPFLRTPCATFNRHGWTPARQPSSSTNSPRRPFPCAELRHSETPVHTVGNLHDTFPWPMGRCVTPNDVHGAFNHLCFFRRHLSPAAVRRLLLPRLARN
jgi:hypothetical protein